jgi:hypothetical protein
MGPLDSYSSPKARRTQPVSAASSIPGGCLAPPPPRRRPLVIPAGRPSLLAVTGAHRKRRREGARPASSRAVLVEARGEDVRAKRPARLHCQVRGEERLEGRSGGVESLVVTQEVAVGLRGGGVVECGCQALARRPGAAAVCRGGQPACAAAAGETTAADAATPMSAMSKRRTRMRLSSLGAPATVIGRPISGQPGRERSAACAKRSSEPVSAALHASRHSRRRRRRRCAAASA